MTMRKSFSSNDRIKILNKGQEKDMFLPGYTYVVGTDLYTVIKAFVADNQEMRQIRSETGELTDIPVPSIAKDHDSHANGGLSVQVLEPDKNVVMTARARGERTVKLADDQEDNED